MDIPTINILMVDDRTENLIALEAVLASPQYNLIKASSGEEALKWVLKKEFAVILLDVQMPGIDGFETARLIRAREKSNDIPIIFITALSQTLESVLSGYSAGAIDYIFKPFHPSILKSKVEGFVKIHLAQRQLQQQNELISLHAKELEEAYHKLQKSEALARAIGETSLDTILTLKPDGKILTSNPSAVKMFGFNSEELLNLSLIIPMFRQIALEEIDDQTTIETMAEKKGGHLFPVDIQLSKAWVEEGSVYVCSIRDITERKNQYARLEELVQERTEALLISHERLEAEMKENKKMVQIVQENEAKYRQLVEESPEAILVRKVDSTKWSFINKTGLKLFGATSKDEIIGKDIFTCIHPEDHHLVRENMFKIKSGKPLDMVEERFIRLDGEIVDVQVKIIPFMYNGEPSLHIVARDITELKKSREFISQSEKLTVVGELAAGIAHEIRNPLTSLRGFTQLLSFKGDDVNQEYSTIMLTEIDRINTIVSELLLLAKPNKLDFAPVNLIEILENTVILMNGQAMLRDVEIKMNNKILSSQTPEFFGVADKMKQVFINTIQNSIEAMENGGEITITIKEENQFFLIEIVDQGRGIPKKFLEKVGKPFFTTKDKGTGLGLMICYNIVESHNGNVHIYSEEGKGTEIKIYLPIHNQDETKDIHLVKNPIGSLD